MNSAVREKPNSFREFSLKMVFGNFILDNSLLFVKGSSLSFLKRRGNELLFERISALCKSKSISISKLEKDCGLGNGTVRGWETSSPTVDRLKRVAVYFGVTVDSLLDDTRIPRQ